MSNGHNMPTSFLEALTNHMSDVLDFNSLVQANKLGYKSFINDSNEKFILALNRLHQLSYVYYENLQRIERELAVNY